MTPMARPYASRVSRPAGTSGAAMPTSVFLAGLFCVVVVGVFLLASPRCQHWFVLPVALGGFLMAVDAIDWIRGRLDVFDPVGIIGLLGVHFFFLAPLLQVYWGAEMTHVKPPPDWRPWLGWMAVLNVLGLLAYRLIRGKAARVRSRHRVRHWRLDRRKFGPIVASGLLISGVLQLVVYQQHGGLMGYIAAFEAREGFTGQGWIFMVSESFPILALMVFAVYARDRPRARSWMVLGLALLLFLCLKLLFGGLRGSRSNTVWGLFWAVGILHLWVRPVPKKVISLGVIFLIAFMYFYSFYKAAGREALKAFESSEARTELEQETHRGPERLLIGDLSRCDVQAYLLYRLSSPQSDYQLGWGRTYLGAAAILIPRQWWPDRPPGKVKEGTEALWGEGTYDPPYRVASRVYGLAGEAMLNFGPFLVPFAFLLLGGLVRFIRRVVARLGPGDSRWLLVPLLVNLCFVVLASDSDNVLFFLIKNGVVPILIITLSSTKTILRSSAPRRAD